MNGNGTVIANGTSSRIFVTSTFLTILTVQRDDAGLYTCKAENNLGKEVSETVLIVYQSKNIVKIQITGYNNPSATESCHNTSPSTFQVSF